jgi:hypothetical protein
MTPTEPRTAVGRLSATLAFRPDAERVRLRLGTPFSEHRDDLWPGGEPTSGYGRTSTASSQCWS